MKSFVAKFLIYLFPFPWTSKFVYPSVPYKLTFKVLMIHTVQHRQHKDHCIKAMTLFGVNSCGMTQVQYQHSWSYSG